MSVTISFCGICGGSTLSDILGQVLPFIGGE